MKNICLICHEHCNHPAVLMLNCDCNYTVHYKCYKKWWNMNTNCMICMKQCEEPYSYNHFSSESLYYEFLNMKNRTEIVELRITNKGLHLTVLFLSYILVYLFDLPVPLIMLPIISFFYFIFIIP